MAFAIALPRAAVNAARNRHDGRFSGSALSVSTEITSRLEQDRMLLDA